MLSKPFDKPEPGRGTDLRLRAGWEAEQDTAFRLQRAFGDPALRDVRVFNDIRLPVTFESGARADGDFFQIDHLVLHRSGFAAVESKSVHGELHVDRLGQWQRRGARGADNIPSPVTQVRQQVSALRGLLQAYQPPLLNRIAGVLRPKIAKLPVREFVAIGSAGRFAGSTRAFEDVVMKVDAIVDAVSAEIARHRQRAGVMGFVRGVIANDESGDGAFNLADDELDRIEAALLSQHRPLRTPRPSSEAPQKRPDPTLNVPEPQRTRPVRIEQLEPLTCGACHSINVRVIYARDYCLRCDECERFTPLRYACPQCGGHAAIRKDGACFYRQCDGAGGCGQEIVFARHER